MRRKYISIIASCILVIGSGLLLACQKTPQDPKVVLTERANQYWQAKIKKDIQKVYEYEDPEFRKKVSFSDYAMYFGGAAIQWVEAVVKKVDIQGTDAKVYTRIRYYSLSTAPFQQDGRVRTIADQWRLIDGKWYHLMAPAGHKTWSEEKKEREQKKKERLSSHE